MITGRGYAYRESRYTGKEGVSFFHFWAFAVSIERTAPYHSLFTMLLSYGAQPHGFHCYSGLVAIMKIAAAAAATATNRWIETLRRLEYVVAGELFGEQC